MHSRQRRPIASPAHRGRPDAMIANATKGKNAMPPMGTCMDCSADDIAVLVDYMVSKSR